MNTTARPTFTFARILTLLLIGPAAFIGMCLLIDAGPGGWALTTEFGADGVPVKEMGILSERLDGAARVDRWCMQLDLPTNTAAMAETVARIKTTDLYKERCHG